MINMASMMPILQSLMQLGPKVDEIQAAPQIDATMIQQNNQGGLMGGEQGEAPTDIMSALLENPAANTGDLAKAQMAYSDTQTSRLPGIAGGLEGVVDMFRAGDKQEELGNQMQTAADAMYKEQRRIESKEDAEKEEAELQKEMQKRERGNVIMQLAMKSGKSVEESTALGDLAYGSEETARKIFETLNPESSTFQKEAEFINSQGGDLTPQEMEERFMRQGQTNIHNPPPTGYRYTADGGMEMIPNGPADVEHQLKLAQLGREEAKAADEAASAQFDARKASVKQVMDIDNAIEQIGRTMGYVNDGTTGLMGHFMSMVPGSDATQLQEFLKTQRANLAFGQLKEMREASKTGGALGNVSNVELGLLEAAYTSLSTAKPEELQKSLVNFMEKLYATRYALENEESFDSQNLTVSDMKYQMNKHVNERIAAELKIPPAAMDKLYRDKSPERFDNFEKAFGWRPRNVRSE